MRLVEVDMSRGHGFNKRSWNSSNCDLLGGIFLDVVVALVAKCVCGCGCDLWSGVSGCRVTVGIGCSRGFAAGLRGLPARGLGKEGRGRGEEVSGNMPPPSVRWELLCLILYFRNPKIGVLVFNVCFRSLVVVLR